MKKTTILITVILLLSAVLSSCSFGEIFRHKTDDVTSTDITISPVTEAPEDTANEVTSENAETSSASTTAEDTTEAVTKADTTAADTTVPDTTVPVITVPDTTEAPVTLPPETEPPVTAAPIVYPDVDLSLYTMIDNPVGRSIGFLPSLVDGGIRVQYQNIPNESEFGTVLSIAYEGIESGDKIFIQNGTSVTVTVSRGKHPDLTGTVVYLTFDDGPNAKNTPRLVEILSRRGIRATFFQVGTYISAYPSMTKFVYDSGNVVGCHTYDHTYSNTFDTEEGFINEIRQWEQAVTYAVGKVPETRVFRFPGGSRKRLYADTLTSLGYKGFDWNALNNDCLLKKCPSYMTRLEYVKTSFVSTLSYSLSMRNAPHIILMHETYSETADMLDFAIDYLSSLGCLFSTCDNLSESWFY